MGSCRQWQSSSRARWIGQLWPGKSQQWTVVKTSNELPHINDPAQGSNSIRPVNHVCATASILHNGTCDHDNILGGVGQFLDNKVDHLSQAGIFVLEELRDAEEQGSGFVRRELLARVKKKGNLGQEDSAFPRLYRRAVEQTRWTIQVNIARASSRARGPARSC